ncbi:hypothetical protein AK812_SmicGene40748 [Symbiodinium microadriaticum]|uniref:Uncharacterized protein n=1 Tax=Symbiodinium microadriaticum TaxID=2951 RepID=A0A1Q9C800_SYMMI|nr:hypothetical protein AK812_SmicGene40748 [Symbiodinium microadriaticum]
MLSAHGIKGIMGLGDKMSKSHLDRFKSFEKLPPKQAVLALCADMGAEDWNTQEETRKYAEKHLRILSGDLEHTVDDINPALPIMRPVRDVPMNAKIKTKKGGDARISSNQRYILNKQACPPFNAALPREWEI